MIEGIDVEAEEITTRYKSFFKYKTKKGTDDQTAFDKWIKKEIEVEDEETDIETNIKSITKTTTKEKSCKFCSKTIKSKNMSHHFESCVGLEFFNYLRGVENFGRSSCGDCGKIYLRKNEKRHKCKLNKKETLIICEYCGFNFEKHQNCKIKRLVDYLKHKDDDIFKEKKAKSSTCTREEFIKSVIEETDKLLSETKVTLEEIQRRRDEIAEYEKLEKKERLLKLKKQIKNRKIFYEKFTKEEEKFRLAEQEELKMFNEWRNKNVEDASKIENSCKKIRLQITNSMLMSVCDDLVIRQAQERIQWYKDKLSQTEQGQNSLQNCMYSWEVSGDGILELEKALSTRYDNSDVPKPKNFALSVIEGTYKKEDYPPKIDFPKLKDVEIVKSTHENTNEKNREKNKYRNTSSRLQENKTDFQDAWMLLKRSRRAFSPFAAKLSFRENNKELIEKIEKQKKLLTDKKTEKLTTEFEMPIEHKNKEKNDSEFLNPLKIIDAFYHVLKNNTEILKSSEPIDKSRPSELPLHFLEKMMKQKRHRQEIDAENEESLEIIYDEPIVSPVAEHKNKNVKKTVTSVSKRKEVLSVNESTLINFKPKMFDKKDHGWKEMIKMGKTQADVGVIKKSKLF